MAAAEAGRRCVTAATTSAPAVAPAAHPASWREDNVVATRQTIQMLADTGIRRRSTQLHRAVVRSWAWEGTTNEANRHKAVSARAQDDPTNSSSNHNRGPTFPRRSPVQRNRARMGQQDYRRINSVGSLFLRYTLLSYLYVLLTVEYIRPREHPFRSETRYLTSHPTLYVLSARESSCNSPHKTLSTGRRVLRISKRPEPVNHCPLFLVHPARTIELQSITPSYS